MRTAAVSFGLVRRRKRSENRILKFALNNLRREDLRVNGPALEVDQLNNPVKSVSLSRFRVNSDER